MIAIKPLADTRREVNITEWADGVRAFVREMDVLDRLVVNDLIDTFLGHGEKSPEERAEAGLNACIMTLADGEGNQLLDPSQLPELKKASFEPVARVVRLLLDTKAEDDSLKKG